MEKEFVPYELALRMKQLGFDEPCFGYYNYNGTHFFDYKPKTDDKNLTKAPLYQQSFRWFREKYDLHYCPFPKQHFPDNRINDIYYYEIFISDGEEIAFDDGTYIIGESLESTALEKLIEIVEISNQQINK